MACVRHDCLVECVEDDVVVLREVSELSRGSVLYDPITSQAGSVVERVVHERIGRARMHTLFGLTCAAAQPVFFNGMWSRAEHVVADSHVEVDVVLVGFVLHGTCTIRVNGVICRGLRNEVLKRRLPDREAITLRLQGCPLFRSECPPESWQFPIPECQPRVV